MIFFLILLLFVNSLLAACPDGAIQIPSNIGGKWSCLSVIASPASFLTAELQCEQNGGHLISIPNGFFNLFVAQEINSRLGNSTGSSRVWIGVSDVNENGWQNVDDNSITTFFDWAPGEPVSSTGYNKCVYVDSNGLWYNDNCLNSYSYVCGTNKTSLPSTIVSTTQSATTPSSSVIPPSCNNDIVVLIDESYATKNTANFDQELAFLTNKLLPSWTVNPQNIEVLSISYALYTNHVFGDPFHYNSTDQLISDINQRKGFDPYSPPSITAAFGLTLSHVYQRRNNTNLSILLITYSSNYDDILTAVDKLNAINGVSQLVVVGVGDNIINDYLYYLSGTVLTTSYSYDINTANAINQALCQPLLPTSLLSTVTSSTARTTTFPNNSIPAYTCRSYIPFAYDVSQKLSTDQFTNLRSFLLNPFLQPVFPIDIQPAPFSRYTIVNIASRRLNNVTDLITYITVETNQIQDADSDITQPLNFFFYQGVTNYGDGLPVNTVIFAGSILDSEKVTETQNLVNNLTANGNTVTVVLVDPNIDQTNYKKVTGLNIVVWSDTATTISNIEANMKCSRDVSAVKSNNKGKKVRLHPDIFRNKF